MTPVDQHSMATPDNTPRAAMEEEAAVTEEVAPVKTSILAFVADKSRVERRTACSIAFCMVESLPMSTSRSSSSGLGLGLGLAVVLGV